MSHHEHGTKSKTAIPQRRMEPQTFEILAPILYDS